MAGIGHITSRRSVHCHCPDLVRIAINRFRGSNRAASVLYIQSLRTSMEEVENHKSLLGFGTIFRLKAVRFLTALTLLFLFAQGLAEIAIPVYSQKTLGAGAAGYGLLMSAFGVGSLLALTLISQFWSRNKQQGLSLA